MTEANLLWTGGWDSTFRLLYLIRVHHRVVQPYYIIDHERHSFADEIRAMYSIREAIFERWPETRGLIRPTVFTAREDIAPNEEVTRKVEQMNVEYRRIYGFSLGSQNEWLARFAAQTGLRDLEMCIHQVQGFGRLEEVADRYFTTVGDSLVIREELAGLAGPFAYFHFPVLTRDKMELYRIAERHGFADLLELTWFCFTPRGGKPCGRCNPCKFVMQHGLFWRIPPARRLHFLLITRLREALRKKEWARRLARILLKREGGGKPALTGG